MKTIAVKIKVALLSALFGVAGLYASSAANAQSTCRLCDAVIDDKPASVNAWCYPRLDGDQGEEVSMEDTDGQGRTALLVAAKIPNVNMVRILLAGPHGCDPANPATTNPAGHTPLMWAAKHGGTVGIEIADLLYSSPRAPREGDDGYNEFINMQKTSGGKSGWTAADYAYDAGNYGFLVTLLARGGKTRAQSEEFELRVGSALFEHVLGKANVEGGDYQRIAEAMLRDNNLNPPYDDEASLFDWAVVKRKGELATQMVGHIAEDVSSEDIDALKLFLDEGETFASADAALRHAAENNNDGVVRVLITMGVDESLVDSQDRTPLMLAAKAGSGSAVSVLVGHDMEAGYSLLYSAAGEGDVDVVSVLLEHGELDADRANDDEKTAVYIAAEEGQGPVVSVLVGDNEDAGYAALYKAVRDNNVAAVSVLIGDMNLDANRKEASSGDAALHIAAEGGRSGVVAVLIEHDGLSVNLANSAGKTATDIAFARHREIAISLIVRGNGVFKDHDVFSDSHVISYLGSGQMDRSVAASVVTEMFNAGEINPQPYGTHSSMFHWAVSEQEHVMQGMLIRDVSPLTPNSAVSEVTLYLRRGDNTVNKFMYEAARFGNAAVVSVLIAMGADPEFRCCVNGSRTPLSRAAWRGHAGIASVYIHYGLDVNHSFLHFRPIDYAAWNGHLSFVETLIAAGVDAGPSSSGYTPLKFAAYYGHLDVVRALIRYRPDVNETAGNGGSALHSVIRGGRSNSVPIVQELIAAGANLSLRQEFRSQTPLMVAADYARPSMVSILIAHGVDAGEVRGNTAHGSSALFLAIFAAEGGDGLDFIRGSLSDSVSVIRLLLSNGADMGLPNTYSYGYPLQRVVRRGSAEVLEAFMDHSAMEDEPGLLEDIIFSATYEILVEGELERRLESLRIIMRKLRQNSSLTVNCSSNFTVEVDDEEISFATWAKSAMDDNPLHAEKVKRVLRNCPSWPHVYGASGASGASSTVDASDEPATLWDLDGGDADTPIFVDLENFDNLLLEETQ